MKRKALFLCWLVLTLAGAAQLEPRQHLDPISATCPTCIVDPPV